MRRVNSVILILVVVFLAIGIIMVYSSSAFTFISEQVKGSSNIDNSVTFLFLRKQLIPLIIGSIMCFTLIKLDYHLLEKVSYYFLGLVVLLLIGVLIFGPTINGVQRWLKIFGISIQPSEFAKIAMIIFIADFISRKEPGDLKKTVLPIFGILAVIGVLIGLEPSFGILFVICSTVFVMLFVGGVKVIHLITPVILVVSIVVIGLFNSPKFEYAKARVKKYAVHENVKTESDVNGKPKEVVVNYQLQQSLYGIGAGGLIGKGLGRGKAKLLFLPYPHTDFIFSIISEEFGFIGGVVICLLFLGFLMKGVQIGWLARDKFGSLLAVGVSFLIFISASVHVCVACGLLPTTGVPLPFISFGGSNLISSLMGVGILLSVSKQMKIKSERV